MSSAESQKRQAIETHSLQAQEFAASYAAATADAYRTCFSYSRRRLAAWLDRCLPSPAAGLRLLDVGCGTGHHLAELRARGFSVAGVDGSEPMLEHARRNNPGIELQRADVEALPFPDASFDVVLCVEVLRYLPDPAACLRQLARVLRPGGLCLATATPLLNMNGYWLVNRLATRLPLPGLVRLKQFFSTSWGLRRRLVEVGFKEPAIHGVYLGPINWIERLLPAALPRALRAWEPVDAALADRVLLRELSNMFLVCAVRS
jgi:ubiquinone/menaquinone biosynthesis C-methylase UbiE